MSVDDKIKAYKNKKRSEYSKQYRATHPEYVEGRKQYMKEYLKRPEVVAHRKEYDATEHMRAWRRAYVNNRYKTDPLFRAKILERNRAYRQRMKLLKKQQAESTKGESTDAESTDAES